MSRIEAAFAGPCSAQALATLSAPDACWTRGAPAHAPPADPPPALLDAIYDAALAPERWPDLLAALAACLGGSAATLHCGPAAGPFRITTASGLGEAALRGYESRYGALDPIATGAAWAAPANAREAAGADLERTEFFAGWMRPNGFDDALCLDLLPPGAAHGASLRVARPPRAPRFGPAEAAVLARLAPHLRRAAELHRRSSPSAQPAPAEQLAGALDRLAAGVALLDAGGALVWANRTAEPLLRGGGDGLSLDRGGVLRAAAPGAAEALRRLVTAAAAGREGAMPVPRPDGRAALALHAAPLPARERVLPAEPRRPSVLLLLSDPERGAATDAALQGRLRAIYGLTAAEATVAARAARGAGLPEVARSLGLAVATARTHAQRVFSKAGVRGQAELARQVERLSLLRAAER
jgi:DNA-binding CsgD family transcriptional regulator